MRFKNFIRILVTRLLAFRAKRFLRQHHVQVIAVTGSIGKTSTKEAIDHILKARFKTHKSPAGFNTELGISLAVLSEEHSGFSSPSAWLGILKRVFFGEKKAYQKIILEMGADKPGDIKRLIRIAPPDIGVVTNVNPVHVGKGQFGGLTDIQREKNTLIKTMGRHDLAVLNADDPLVRDMETGAKKITYGLDASANVRAEDVKATAKNLKFKVSYEEEKATVTTPVLGHFQVYALLPAIAVGLKLGLSLKDCAEALKTYQLPPGRMNPIEGINKSLIIDSSYNASPTSVAKALELLGQLEASRRIAVLGTMNELGDLTEKAHLEAGQLAAQIADILVAVGQEAATLKQGAKEAGMPDDRIFTFLDAEETGHFLKKMLSLKDVVLVKGSQNRVRLERLVKVIMKHPEQAETLLCRQDEAWGKI